MPGMSRTGEVSATRVPVRLSHCRAVSWRSGSRSVTPVLETLRSWRAVMLRPKDLFEGRRAVRLHEDVHLRLHRRFRRTVVVALISAPVLDCMFRDATVASSSVRSRPRSPLLLDETLNHTTPSLHPIRQSGSRSVCSVPHCWHCNDLHEQISHTMKIHDWQ